MLGTVGPIAEDGFRLFSIISFIDSRRFPSEISIGGTVTS